MVEPKYYQMCCMNLGKTGVIEGFFSWAKPADICRIWTAPAFVSEWHLWMLVVCLKWLEFYLRLIAQTSAKNSTRESEKKGSMNLCWPQTSSRNKGSIWFTLWTDRWMDRRTDGQLKRSKITWPNKSTITVWGPQLHSNVPCRNFFQWKRPIGAVISISANFRVKNQGHQTTKYGQKCSFGAIVLF